jgi:thiamine biosynthesis protein ThiS
MSVFVNGRMHDLPEPPTLAALIVAIAPPPPFAVARNGEIVQRGTYEDCRIDRGDRIDIVRPTAGG